LEECANAISVLVIAIPDYVSDMCAASYGHFLIFSARTAAGAPNIIPDHQDGKHSHMSLRFDRSTRLFFQDTTSFANSADFCVLVPGEDLTPETIEKLKDWASRPLVALDCSPPTAKRIKERVVESSSDDDEPLVSVPSKRQRHIRDDDD
jgi:hypothetical protein